MEEETGGVKSVIKNVNDNNLLVLKKDYTKIVTLCAMFGDLCATFGEFTISGEFKKHKDLVKRLPFRTIMVVLHMETEDMGHISES